MENDFDGWNKTKKIIDSEIRPLYQEREIWWCFLGKNVGNEENGKGEKFLRPILILKKFNKNVFIGIAMTSTPKSGIYYYKRIYHESYLILSQIRIFDAKRLYRLSGKISNNEFYNIKQKIKDLLNL